MTTKNKAGRPRLPDPENPVMPPKTRLSSRDLSERDLEARRYAERIAKREYRQAIREGRHNPRRLKTGEDGLQAMQAQRIAELEKQVEDLTTRVGELNVANMMAQTRARANG